MLFADAGDEIRYHVFLCGGPRCTVHDLPRLLGCLERAIWDAELEEVVTIDMGNCLGHCTQGPNLMVFPGSYRYTNLTTEHIGQIVTQHLVGGVPVAHLLDAPVPSEF